MEVKWLTVADDGSFVEPDTLKEISVLRGPLQAAEAPIKQPKWKGKTVAALGDVSHKGWLCQVQFLGALMPLLD
jgi:hypothetical protein